MVAGDIGAGFFFFPVVCFVLWGSFKVVLRTAGFCFCFVFEGKGIRAAVSLHWGVL